MGLISIIIMLKVNKKKRLTFKKNIARKDIVQKTESSQISLYKDKKNLIILILIWLIVAFISGLIINNVNVNRINIIFYPMIIITGVGIYASVKS